MPRCLREPTAIDTASSAAGARDNTTFDNTNTGSGLSKQAETAALFQNRQSLEIPANATDRSVIAAQTQPDGVASEPGEKLGPDLPEVDMPDPLPTSPFFLQLREAR